MAKELEQGDSVLVPVSSGPPSRGEIIGQEWNFLLGEYVWIVKFRSGHTARLTDQEVIKADNSKGKIDAS